MTEHAAATFAVERASIWLFDEAQTTLILQDLFKPHRNATCVGPPCPQPNTRHTCEHWKPNLFPGRPCRLNRPTHL